MGKSGKRGSGRAAKAAKAGLFTLTIAAFVVVCTGIGKLHASPFAPLAIEGASLASSDDAGTVVVDQGGTRLLFASPAGELRGLYGMAGRETPIDEVSLVRQVGNDVLVAGVKRAEDGAVFEILAEPEDIDQRHQLLNFKIRRLKGGV